MGKGSGLASVRLLRGAVLPRWPMCSTSWAMAPVHVAPSDYKDLVLFLATAGIVVPLFKRLRISPILGFLGAGVALGPFGLGALEPWLPWLRFVAVDRPEDVAQLAEFGVVFLLFTIGLELSWERLRAMRRMVFGLGILQVA